MELAIGDQSLVPSEEAATADPARTEKKFIKAEKKLVDRCVRGEVAAWEEIYTNHHPALLHSVAVLLGAKGSDRNLVDELAAQVWYSLVEEDGKLLGRFSPKRGARLNTFFRAVARDVTSRYFRAERRRLRRERVAAQGAPNCEHEDPDLDDSLSEFLGSLSESERRFTEAYLLSEYTPDADGQADPDQRSAAAIWQFSRRIRLKLRKFFGV